MDDFIINNYYLWMILMLNKHHPKVADSCHQFVFLVPNKFHPIMDNFYHQFMNKHHPKVDDILCGE